MRPDSCVCARNNVLTLGRPSIQRHHAFTECICVSLEIMQLPPVVGLLPLVQHVQARRCIHMRFCRSFVCVNQEPLRLE